MRWKTIIVTCGLFLSTAASLNAQSLELTTNPFEENSGAAQISGQLVTGVQLKSAPDEALFLQAYIPKKWAGKTVCSRVVTVDGLYSASNEYRVDINWTGGMAQLPYPSKEPNFLVGRLEDEISVRVSLSTCEQKVVETTIATWSGVRDSPALLINSFQAEVVFAYIDDAPAPIRCQPISLAGRSAYDTRCPLDEVTTKGKVRIKLLRIDDGKPLPPTQLFVWLP